MKQIERLLFLQGNLCFFSHHPNPKGEESIEHLSARANGGNNVDENCVACCKSVNAALGSLWIKEKFRAILSHRSGFTCPRHNASDTSPKAAGSLTAQKIAERLLPEALANLKKRGTKRPAKLTTLRNALGASFPDANTEVIDALLRLLRNRRHVDVKGTKVVYPKLQAPV